MFCVYAFLSPLPVPLFNPVVILVLFIGYATAHLFLIQPLTAKNVNHLWILYSVNISNLLCFSLPYQL